MRFRRVNHLTKQKNQPGDGEVLSPGLPMPLPVFKGNVLVLPLSPVIHSGLYTLTPIQNGSRFPSKVGLSSQERTSSQQYCTFLQLRDENL